MDIFCNTEDGLKKHPTCVHNHPGFITSSALYIEEHWPKDDATNIVEDERVMNENISINVKHV